MNQVLRSTLASVATVGAVAGIGAGAAAIANRVDPDGSANDKLTKTAAVAAGVGIVGGGALAAVGSFAKLPGDSIRMGGFLLFLAGTGIAALGAGSAAVAGGSLAVDLLNPRND